MTRIQSSAKGLHCPDLVVASIYENLSAEDPWNAAITALRDALGANQMALRISQRKGRPRETISIVGASNGNDQWEEFLTREGFPVKARLGETCEFNWRDVTPKSALAGNFLAAGVCSVLLYSFESTAEGDCTLIAARSDTQPPFGVEEHQLLRAAGLHFQRAYRARLEILKGRQVSTLQAEALERLAIAGFMINQNRFTQPLNSRAVRFIEERDGLKVVDGFLHAIEDQDDRTLQSAIRCVLDDKENSATIRGLSIQRASGRRDLGVLVSAQESRCLRTNRMERIALIFVRDPQSVTNPNISLMQQLFSFTRAEAVMATRLAKGMRLEDIEHELNIRHNTARAHLRSMFSKAEVNRQSQLVHLLANCVAPLGVGEAVPIR
jgi:DNA-binding CsgD family transcriptional regulator